LKVLSSKAKKRAVIYKKIAGQFEKGKKYTEMEVNGILKQIYPEDLHLAPRSDRPGVLGSDE
jgi:hypothetical protein